MRYFVAFLIILGFCSSICLAQTDDEEIERIRQDFKEVKVVAQVKVDKLEVDSEWGKPREGGGYTVYRFTGKVIEPFKGKFAKDDPIVFYSFIEGQPYKSVEDLMPGDHIRFLEIYKNKVGLTNLSEMENSARLASELNISTLRKLRKSR